MKAINCSRDAVLAGIALCILGVFPLAGVVALVYRFPVPFYGYTSGFAAVLPAMLGVLFYQLLGGCIVLGLVGVAVGLLTWRYGRKQSQLAFSRLSAVALLADLPIVVLLAILDKLIGAW